MDQIRQFQNMLGRSIISSFNLLINGFFQLYLIIEYSFTWGQDIGRISERGWFLLN